MVAGKVGDDRKSEQAALTAVHDLGDTTDRGHRPVGSDADDVADVALTDER